MSGVTADAEPIVPSGQTIQVDGVPAYVSRLKTREMLQLLRVLTEGMGEGAANIKLATDKPDELQSQIVALVMMSIPNATVEFGEFLMTVVKPQRTGDADQLAKAMDNPDPGVMIDVFEAIATQEKDELVALAGKAQAALGRIQTLYQTKQTTGQ